MFFLSYKFVFILNVLCYISFSKITIFFSKYLSLYFILQISTKYKLMLNWVYAFVFANAKLELRNRRDKKNCVMWEKCPTRPNLFSWKALQHKINSAKMLWKEHIIYSRLPLQWLHFDCGSEFSFVVKQLFVPAQTLFIYHHSILLWSALKLHIEREWQK